MEYAGLVAVMMVIVDDLMVKRKMMLVWLSMVLMVYASYLVMNQY